MCNNDFITKNKEGVSKKKDIKKGKKQLMTKNQRRKNNQNNLEDKLLELKLKDLERQQSIIQQAIKRERYKLLDQFMNHKANNLSYMKKNINQEENEEEINVDLTSLKNNKSLYEVKKYSETEEKEDEKYSMTSRSHKSYSSFSTQDLLRYANFINQPPPTPKPNNFSKIDERFIDQKVKYFPSYLRKSKTFIATTDIDTALSE